MSKENIDYRAIVERIAEILHGGITDVYLLTVTVRSYKDRFAKVEVDRDVLAAENAALKEFIHRDCLVPDINGYDKDAADFMPETPATDAFLREVRAQGVQLYADKVLAANMFLAKNAGLENTSSVFAHLKYEAEEFAAQLRQGGAA